MKTKPIFISTLFSLTLVFVNSIPNLSRFYTSSASAQSSNSVILQESGTLGSGDNVLESDQSLYDEYTFSAEAGQSLTIVLTSKDFDTYVIVEDGEGNRLGKNDDGGEGTNSQLTLTFTQGGTYRLLVNGYDVDSRGDYNLVVRLAQEREIQQARADKLLQQGIEQFNRSDYPGALASWQEALDIYTEIGDRRGEAQSLGNLGLAYFSLGDYPKAIEFHSQDLAISREIGDRRGEANSLGNLGLAYFSLGDYPKAIDFHQKSLAIKREIGDLPGEGNSLNNLGLAFFNNNQLDQAQTHLYQAITVYENIRELIDSNQDAWNISIFDTQTQAYLLLQKVLIAQNQPLKALEISERGRNRALIDLLLARSSEELPRIPTVADIQTIAKQQNSTLVEYAIVDDEIYIWVIKPNGEITFRSQNINLPEGTTLTDLVQFSRCQIGVRGRGKQDNSKTSDDNINRLQQLHQLLITPIADLLPQEESERVIFIPHQELFLVPFAALQDEDGQYLIEKHTILSAPSIQSLSFTREHWQRVKNLTGNPLIVGNPTMPQEEVGHGENKAILKPLPDAETEAEFIADLLNTQAITGDDATETEIRAKMKDADLIHLATHSLLDGINGIGSPGVIALTPDGNHDGWLESREIMEEFGQPENPLLKAKLVVLSACETGRGEIRGEGVVGLSRSLIAAGVPSLVVSLWKIPDDYTADLMELFYTNLYTEKMDKATAMREAMLAMISEDSGNSDPIAWAGFTLMGEIDVSE